MGKRICTPKELVQRDFDNRVNTQVADVPQKFNFIHTQEDFSGDQETMSLIGSPSSEGTNDTKSKQTSPAMRNHLMALPIKSVNQLIAKEITKTADALELDIEEFQAWVDLQVMIPSHKLLALLRIARGHHLDPLKEEVALALYDDCHWQAYITVEGYSKLLNRHPAFDGIIFTQSEELTNGIPIWMECTIYRKDRSWPIIVREYFEEVKGEQAIWQKMPRRMLRHRVMQQCARLAVG